MTTTSVGFFTTASGENQSVELVNKKNGHNKFYKIRIYKTIADINIFYLEVHWGRIGNTGRKRVISTHSGLQSAVKSGNLKLLEKISDKGYYHNLKEFNTAGVKAWLSQEKTQLNSTFVNKKLTPKESEKTIEVDQENERFIALME